MSARHGTAFLPERHGCWQGLALVLARGIEGYPPPRVVAPFWQTAYYAERKATEPSVAPWGIDGSGAA